jgi:hypothetical protein
MSPPLDPHAVKLLKLMVIVVALSVLGRSSRIEVYRVALV